MTARRHLSRAAALAGLAVLLTACGPHTDKTIGMRSTALSLQFARPDLAKPIPPNIVLQILPVPAVPHVHVTQGPPPQVLPAPPPPPPPVSQCPAAKPATPLTESTTAAPRAGQYPFATKGATAVFDGTQTASAPLPPLTQVAVSGAQPVDPGSTIAAEGGAPASGKEQLYTITTQLSDNVKQIDTIEVSATSVNLAQRTVVDGRRSLTITPTPQVQLVVFGPVGSSWKSSGTDQGTAATLTYNGTISAITKTVVCAQPVNAYVVTYTEKLVSTLDQEVIQTVDGDPNTLTIAPQLGGLVLARQVSTDDIRLDSDLSGYVEVTMKYTSLLQRLEPVVGAGP